MRPLSLPQVHFTCLIINPPKEGMRGNCYFPETFTSIPASHLEFYNILVVALE